MFETCILHFKVLKYKFCPLLGNYFHNCYAPQGHDMPHQQHFPQFCMFVVFILKLNVGKHWIDR